MKQDAQILVNSFFKFKHFLETAYLSRDRALIEESIDKCIAIAETSAEYREAGTCALVQLWEIKWATNLYRMADDYARTPKDLLELTNEVFQRLGDREWATNLLDRAGHLLADELRISADSAAADCIPKWIAAYKEVNPDSNEPLIFLSSITGCLLSIKVIKYFINAAVQVTSDHNWLYSIYEHAKTIAAAAEDFTTLADIAIKHFNNEDEARANLKQALDRAETATEYIVIADCAYRLHEPAEKITAIMEMAIDKAASTAEWRAVGQSLCLYLFDEGSAYQAFARAEKEAATTAEYILLAESLVTYLEDFREAEKLYHTAEIYAESSHEYTKLGYSIYNHFRNKPWAELMFNEALETARTPRDFLALAGGLPETFGGERFRLKVISQWDKQQKSREFTMIDYTV